MQDLLPDRSPLSFLDFNLIGTLDTDQFTRLLIEAYGEFFSSERRPAASVKASVEYCLEQVVLNLISVCGQHDDTLAFVARTNFYSDQRDFLGPRVTSKSVKRVIAFLHDHDLVLVRNGSASALKHKRSMSLVRPSPLFIELLHSFGLKPSDVRPRAVMPLRLRPSKDLSEDHEDHALKLIPFDETDDTRRMTANLDSINALITRCTVELKLSEEQRRALRGRLAAKAKKKGKWAKALRWVSRPLYRVFNDGTFDHGGRFYGPDYQNIPKEFRPYLTINGHPTVEVDFTAMHPTILYARLGIQLIGDPYTVSFCSDRVLVKLTFNALLNAKRKNIRALDEFDARVVGMSWTEFVERVLEHFSTLKQFVCSGEGVRLQRIDSDIAEEIMLRFVRLGIPILPIHDSFVVQAQHEAILVQTMKTVFYERVGYVCSVKIARKRLEQRELGRAAA